MNNPMLEEKIAVWAEQVKIEKNNLEHECQIHPGLYLEIGLSVVEAQYQHHQAKTDFERVESELLSAVKLTPGVFGLEKAPTADLTIATVRLQPTYQEAQQKYLEAELTYKTLAHLQEDMNHRKAMLRDLVTLFIHSYYSSQELSAPSSRLSKNADKDQAFDAAMMDIRKNRMASRLEDRMEEIRED